MKVPKHIIVNNRVVHLRTNGQPVKLDSRPRLTCETFEDKFGEGAVERFLTLVRETTFKKAAAAFGLKSQQHAQQIFTRLTNGERKRRLL